jgi:DNA-binding transcriptional LysR family regulator
MQWSERVGLRVKLRDLHILISVVQSGSMVRAAERLVISQPVVSKVISDLEAVLGVPLLERSRRGIEPTAYGRALVRRGTNVFDELRQAAKEIQYLSDPTAGELRIAGPGTVVGGLFPAAIDHLCLEYPKLTFHVSEIANVVQQFRELRERRVDLVMRRMPESMADAPDLVAEPLFNDPPLIAAGVSSPWTRKRHIELAELAGETWVLPPSETDVSLYLMELFRDAGLSVPGAQVICSSMDMNHALLATGRYLALYPGSLLMFGAKRLAIKALRVNIPERVMPFAVIRVRNRQPNPVEKLFIECVRKLIVPLTGQLRKSGRST